MRATCWHGKRDMRVDNVPDPVIMNQRDAIVRVTATAICGSDLHLYNGFIPTMKKGDIMGHEFMGEVVDVGRDVRNLKAGDRVVVPFAIACGNCFACEAQMYSLCENSNPNAWLAEKLMGIRRRARSAIRTCSAVSPAARPNTRACRSPISAR